MSTRAAQSNHGGSNVNTSTGGGGGAPRIYNGDGDRLMQKESHELDEMDRLILIPDALPTRTPDATPRIRIMWGQHLLEDLLQGRYRTLVCAVNSQDNSSGIIGQLAALLPTSQWDEQSITSHAREFAGGGGAGSGDRVKVLKYDMDMVEVLAILRPATRPNLTVQDLAAAFRIVGEMVEHRPGRVPTASVSFLGARANKLLDKDGREPSFEAVLATMHEAGYHGDVYPSPAMWQLPRIAMYPRYPFSAALEDLRRGGF